MTSKSKVKKAKVNKDDYIKLRTSVQQRNHHKVEMQFMELEKIFAKHISNKGIYPKYTRGSYNLIEKKSQFLIWTKDQK